MPLKQNIFSISSNLIPISLNITFEILKLIGAVLITPLTARFSVVVQDLVMKLRLITSTEASILDADKFNRFSILFEIKDCLQNIEKTTITNIINFD